tara:strand:+ start:1478 stop:2518 length:1041 start_codon:yes stop_codon:yes gene_type:complete
MQNMENSEDIDIDSAWDNFLEDGCIYNTDNVSLNYNNINDENIPKGSDIYISTKTKIAYLSHEIDLHSVFWKINILEYHKPEEGVIKKQMKFNLNSQEELDNMKLKLINLKNVDEYIITQIINPGGRIKFKDIRKISIGLSSKDIVSYRTKKKSAFYNCFVIILRIKDKDEFKEIHVKVFNTGKLEIPGIRTDELLVKVLDTIIFILKPLINDLNITYNLDTCDTVLINSNFTCGFYLNRESLLDILKYKYKINCVFDACQYPGIQCKYNYRNKDNSVSKMSFMIFRTGSVLIVGKCDERILYSIYDFVKNILIREYKNICVKNITYDEKEISGKKKPKKRIILVD